MESVGSPKTSGSDVSQRESGVLSEGISVTLGRALLRPDGRIIVFYVASDNSTSLDAPIIINDANIISSDEQSWPADGYGELRHWPPLTLGWVTFLVSGAAPGDLRVAVNDIQSNGSSVTRPLQLQQLSGLKARIDISEAVIIDSGLCVSSEGVAFGFHEKACTTEFVDPHTVRQKETPAGTTRATPRPKPTPTEHSSPSTPTLTTQSTKSPDDVEQLLFTLCTPWHFQARVKFDNAEIPLLSSFAPTTGLRCVLPWSPSVSHFSLAPALSPVWCRRQRT